MKGRLPNDAQKRTELPNRNLDLRHKDFVVQSA